MKPTVVIRNATVADLDAMVALLAELFSVEADFEFDVDRQRAGLLRMLDGCGKHRCVIVADVEDRTVGMATVQILVSTAEGGEVGLVEDVVVKNDWRGRGIGGKLLASLEQWSARRGLRRLQLLADRENLAGLQFYNKNGWHETRLVCLRKTTSTYSPAKD
ncbi:MAG TPA: GNAT family N-acetyltransferase [Desulfobacterales bacterium]